MDGRLQVGVHVNQCDMQTGKARRVVCRRRSRQVIPHLAGRLVPLVDIGPWIDQARHLFKHLLNYRFHRATCRVFGPAGRSTWPGNQVPEPCPGEACPPCGRRTSVVGFARNGTTEGHRSELDSYPGLQITRPDSQMVSHLSAATAARNRGPVHRVRARPDRHLVRGRRAGRNADRRAEPAEARTGRPDLQPKYC